MISHTSRAGAYYVLFEGDSIDSIDQAAELSAISTNASATTHNMPLAKARRFYRVAEFMADAGNDTDHDGLPDVFELERSGFLDPLNPQDGRWDPDDDGYDTLDEYRSGRNPFVSEPQGSIAAALYYSIAVKRSGSVYSWGQTEFGLGRGTNSSSGIARVSLDSPLRMVSAAGQAVLAIDNERSLWAWGRNTEGQLGIGTDRGTNRPVRVGTNKWSYVSAGHFQSIGIALDGSLWAWGENYRNQLDSTLPRGLIPTPRLINSSRWISAAAAVDVFFAIRADGTLWNWGIGQFFSNVRPNPLTQVGTNKWKYINGSGGHVLAIAADGTLWGWGVAGNFRLGTNFANAFVRMPMRLSNDRWRSVGAGSSHSLAIREDGTLWAWGETGLMFPFTILKTPTQIARGTNWVAVSAGEDHSLVLQRDGSLYSFGKDTFRQLGTQRTDLTDPVQIGNATNWLLAGDLMIDDHGSLHALDHLVPLLDAKSRWKSILKGRTTAVREDGTAWQFSVSYTNILLPPTITATHVLTNNLWSALAADYMESGIAADGTLWGWGLLHYFIDTYLEGETQQATPVLLSAEHWRSIASAETVTLAIREDGSLWGRGRNSNGGVGDGTFSNRVEFVPINTELKWSAVSVGGASYAIASNGSLWTWGYLDYALFPERNDLRQPTPIEIFSETRWRDLAVGRGFGYFIAQEGSLWRFGYRTPNDVGLRKLEQVGDGKWRSVSILDSTVVGIRDDDRLFLWGANNRATGTAPSQVALVNLDDDWGDVSDLSNSAR